MDPFTSTQPNDHHKMCMERHVDDYAILKILCSSERIVNETPNDTDLENIFDEEDGVASSSIFDVSELSLSTRWTIESLSSTIDPLEPTPIGPSITIVGDVPVSALIGVSLHHFNTSTTKEVESSFVDRPDPILGNTNVTIRAISPLSFSRTTAQCRRKFQDDQWNQRFEELLDFRDQYGHVLVPHNHPENTKLAQWVKRYVCVCVCVCVCVFHFNVAKCS
jgi:hypothetical protein